MELEAAAPAASEEGEPSSTRPATAGAHDLAAQATTFEADVEKFLDQALIAEFDQTPLNTLDSVIDARKERDEMHERVTSRAKELLEEDLVKERHARELRELEEVINTTAEPLPSDPAKAKEGSSGGPSSSSSSSAAPSKERAKRASPTESDADALTAAIKNAPFKLEGAGRSRNLKPFVHQKAEFMGESEARTNIEKLQTENELLRKCLQGQTKAGAFDSYFRKNAL